MPQKKKEPTSTTTFFPPNLCRSPGTPVSRLNPGNISNLHKKTRNLTPNWIEGLSLRCAKNFDVNQAIYAEWMMGNSTPVGFRLGGMLCRKDSDSITVSNSPNCLFPFIHYPFALSRDGYERFPNFPFSARKRPWLLAIRIQARLPQTLLFCIIRFLKLKSNRKYKLARSLTIPMSSDAVDCWSIWARVLQFH